MLLPKLPWWTYRTVAKKNASTCLVLYVFISNVAHTTNLSLVLQPSHSDLFLTIKLPLTQTSSVQLCCCLSADSSCNPVSLMNQHNLSHPSLISLTLVLDSVAGQSCFNCTHKWAWLVSSAWMHIHVVIITTWLSVHRTSEHGQQSGGKQFCWASSAA